MDSGGHFRDTLVPEKDARKEEKEAIAQYKEYSPTIAPIYLNDARFWMALEKKRKSV